MANVVDRLGGASSHLAFKAPCRLATTTNITLSGLFAIDGVTPASSDHVDLRRILVRSQTNSAENGIYIADIGTWERAKDFDSVNDIRQGTRIYVYGGSTQSGTYIVTSSVDPSTFDIDTTSITITAVGTFDQVTSALSLSSGGVMSWDSGDVTITHSSSALAFAGAGAGYTFAEGVTMSSALTVSGALTASSASSFSGAVTMSSALTVSGAVTMSSALTVSGVVTLSSALTVAAAVSLASSLTVTGGVQMGSNSRVGTVDQSSNVFLNFGGSAGAAFLDFASGDQFRYDRLNNLYAFGIASGDVLYVDRSTAANETSLRILDANSTSVVRVTVGATNTGGAGFRVLRIPN